MVARKLGLVLLACLGASATAWINLPKTTISPKIIRGGGIGGGSNSKKKKPAKPTNTVTSSGKRRGPKQDGGWFSGYVTQLFQEADVNHDGALSPTEVYELVLQFYIKVNQQAPIAPPSRDRVLLLLKQADTSKSGKLELDEFRRLLQTIYARASSRILTHKVVSLFCAPLLAVSLVQFVRGQPYLNELVQVVPDWVPDPLRQLVTKESFWQTVLTVFFVQQLGGIALGIVDWMWWGGSNPKHADEKYYRGMNHLKAKGK